MTRRAAALHSRAEIFVFTFFCKLLIHNVFDRTDAPPKFWRIIAPTASKNRSLRTEKFFPKPKSDIVLPRHKKIIPVHGCFRHIHDCERGSVTPKTNVEYWQTKRLRNVERDESNLKTYKKEGWKVLTVWKCETKNLPKLNAKLRRFLI